MTADLPAGRELDALVAERVIGNQLCPRCGKGASIRRYALVWCSEECAERAGDFTLDEARQRMPAYSTSIEAAWEVVEHFDSYTVEWNAYYKHHRASLVKYKPEQFGDAVADTPALAICRAALIAVAPASVKA